MAFEKVLGTQYKVSAAGFECRIKVDSSLTIDELADVIDALGESTKCSSYNQMACELRAGHGNVDCKDFTLWRRKS